MQKIYKGFSFRIAVVVYRDFDMGSNSFEIQPFIQDVSKIESFLKCIKVAGGGDIPEDINGALQKVINLDWQSPTRVLVHFADAPCHGSDFHDAHDSHKNPVSDQPWEKIFSQLKSLAINYNFMEIHECTKKMTAKFSELWKGCGKSLSSKSKRFEFRVYPVNTEPLDLIKKITTSIKDSISHSIRNMEDGDAILKHLGLADDNHDEKLFAELCKMTK